MKDPLEREWLETNGLGGYASGTVAGVGTRGYHGLLVAAERAPGVRTMIATSADEWVVGAPPVFLSTHQYPGTLSPQGFKLLEGFEAAPFPTWTYRTGGYRIERKLFMVHGENTTVVRYRLLAGKPVRIGIRFFFVFRDHHARRHESGTWWVVASRAGDAIHCVPSDGVLPATVYARGAYRDDGQWYRRFEYARERERGQPHTEDAYSPFVIELDLTAERGADLIITTESLPPRTASELEEEEAARRAALHARGGRLAVAADQFLVVGSGGRHSVIAGYPWFTDWGRDTMIALPGLAQATGQYREAWLALEGFAAHLKHGILPNRFPDAGSEPEYNSVDASLWLAVAVWRLCEADRRIDGQADGDNPPIRLSACPPKLVEALKSVEEHYTRGTEFGIREDSDGLLVAGVPGFALTWMDARTGDWVVTPRWGKAVEVNALWYNLRMILAGLLETLGGRTGAAEGAELRTRAERTKAAFLATFWWEKTGSMADVITPDGKVDGSLRPNQLLALSLPFPLVDRERGRRVLALIEATLLTPMGLRTLAPDHPDYQGKYGGDQRTRDKAYHQGTAWPWLLGPYSDAVRFVEGETDRGRKKVLAALKSVMETLDSGCIGQIAEIADGDPPHTPNGCPAQAWSVGEVARIMAWVGSVDRRTGGSKKKRSARRPVRPSARRKGKKR